MQQNIPVIDNSFFFRPNNNVHIQYSDECKDYVGVTHKHEFIEVVYIISGKARHIIGDKEYCVKKGDVSVINVNEPHAFLADNDCGEEFLAYDLMFTPDFVDDSLFSGGGFSHLADSFLFYSLFPDKDSFGERFNFIPGCNYELGSVFEKIYHEYKNESVGYVNLIRIYIAEIIVKLLRKIHCAGENGLTMLQKQLVGDVVDYIENNYSIKINTEEIASKMFFNKNYISKLFKIETGLSIHEFVREIRIKEVCKQLLEDDKTITEIASDCGFTDMKSFYHIFQKYTGCTPKAYRDKAKL